MKAKKIFTYFFLEVPRGGVSISGRYYFPEKFFVRFLAILRTSSLTAFFTVRDIYMERQFTMKYLLKYEYASDHPYFVGNAQGMVSGYVSRNVNSQTGVTGMTMMEDCFFDYDGNGGYVWSGRDVRVPFQGDGCYVLYNMSQQMSGKYVKVGEETRSFSLQGYGQTFESDFVVMRNTSNGGIAYVVKECFTEDPFYDDPTVLNDRFDVELQGGGSATVRTNLFVSTGSASDPLSAVTATSMSYYIFYRTDKSHIEMPVPGVLYSTDSGDVFYNASPEASIRLDFDMSAWPMAGDYYSHSGVLSWSEVGMTDAVYATISSYFSGRDPRIAKRVQATLTDGVDPDDGHVWADTLLVTEYVRIVDGPGQNSDYIEIDSGMYDGCGGGRLFSATFHPGTRTVDVQSGCVD